MVKTRERTLMTYLTNPLVRSFQSGLGEPDSWRCYSMDKAVQPQLLLAFAWADSRFNESMSWSSLLSRGFRLLVGGARRRAVCAGVTLGLMSWALAHFGVRAESSSAMALLMVVCGGASLVFVELEWDMARRPAAMLTRGRWHDLVCIQGVSLLATLQCVQSMS